MPEAPVKQDLGGLRIEDYKRGSRNAGKVIAIVFSVLVVSLLIVGGVYAYVHQTPSVQVAAADAPETGPQALLVIGLVAALAVAVIVGRSARRALERLVTES